MRQEDDRYLNEDEDKDFWDDELELGSDIAPRDFDDGQIYPRTSEPAYPSYGDDAENVDDGDDAENVEDDENAENSEDDYYSDPQPPTNSKRQRLFGSKHDDVDADYDNDFYDSDEESEPAKKTKAPKLDPEDPDYWNDEEESPLSEIITGPTRKWKWQLAAVLGCLILIIWAWLWFFRPYSDNAVKYGYITEMERRGSLFKTFEGTMIPYKQVGDPDPFYFRPLRFSVETDSLAAVMKRMMLGCVPVRVEYETYHAPLPWKGEERMVVIKADTADVSKIMPPEYR